MCSLEGKYGLALWSWHTTLTGNRYTIADFHLAKGELLSLGRFLSSTHLQTGIGLALTCDGAQVLASGATDVSSVAFGLLEAHHAQAIVATTGTVNAGSVFLFGRFLTGELANGQPLHKAVTLAQQRLRRITATEIVALLVKLQPALPDIGPLLNQMSARPPRERPFADPTYWAPFFILGNPEVKIAPDS